MLYHRPQSAPSIRSSINPPPNILFQLTGDAAGPPVLSPDGKLIAFTAVGKEGNPEIWVRPIDSLEAHPIEGTFDAYFPFWSPDSRSLAFFVPGKLKRVDLNGGSPTVVTDLKQGKGGTWGPGGVILFSPEPSAPLMKSQCERRNRGAAHQARPGATYIASLAGFSPGRADVNCVTNCHSGSHQRGG